MDQAGIIVDTSETLEAIIARHGKPLNALLLELWKIFEIQPEKSAEWISKLECLYVDRYEGEDSGGPNNRKQAVLGRRRLDARSNRDYVVASYTWGASPDEDATVGAYSVRPRGYGQPVTSDVRNIILDRSTNYMRYVECDNLWIDRECIDQSDSDQKEIALQSMDLVYSFGKYPLALLSVEIRTAAELNLLTMLMRGEFNFNTSRGKMFTQRREMLELLHRITSNRWWRRAWTYQEDYRAFRMVLLMPHHLSLEAEKMAEKNLFGSLKGEICIKSADFRRESTRFCLEFMNATMDSTETKMCEEVISRAPKYTVLLENARGKYTDDIGTPMSATIFADVGRREISVESDRIPITANCCAYPFRPNMEALRKAGCSLSLVILALYIFNGEIFKNGGGGSAPLKCTVYELLKAESLDNFVAPVNQQLTFLKGCRLVDVEVSMDGIEIKGHIWALGGIVKTGPMRDSRRPYDDKDGDLSRAERRTLKQLIGELQRRKYRADYRILVKELEAYLRRDAKAGPRSFSQKYQDIMAKEIVQAIWEGRPLHLARVVDGRGWSKRGFRAIFVMDSARHAADSYIFTSTCETDDIDIDVDKHVSLQIGCRGPLSARPQLFVKRWLNGLLFFGGCHLRKVVFPWPKWMTQPPKLNGVVRAGVV